MSTCHQQSVVIIFALQPAETYLYSGLRQLVQYGPCTSVLLCVLMHGIAFGYTLTYLWDAVAPLSMLPGRAHLWSAVSGQYDVPRVSFGRFKSVLRRRSTSLESTSCISSLHELCRNFQASSQNYIIYGGVWCD